jgi:TRAP-type C4-dicarboxylate transport system permease small subunit
MCRIVKFLDDKFEEVIGVVILGVLMTLIFIGVMMRLLFNSGMPWQEEISRVFYVIVVYLGASYGIRSEDHIRITALTEVLPEKGRKILGIITDIIWGAFNIAIVVISMDLYQHMKSFFGKSAVLEIPLHFIFLTIPLGFLLLTFRMIQSYFRKSEPSDVSTDTDAGGGK